MNVVFICFIGTNFTNKVVLEETLPNTLLSLLVSRFYFPASVWPIPYPVAMLSCTVRIGTAKHIFYPTASKARS
jgi:hypothetical protein